MGACVRRYEVLVREPESQYVPVADRNDSKAASLVMPTVWVSLTRTGTGIWHYQDPSIALQFVGRPTEKKD